MQLRAVLEADLHGLAGIEFKHVARRRAARIGRAAIARRDRRHVALLRYQPALVVEVQDVERDPGVLPPVSLWRQPVVDAYNYVAGGRIVAAHKPAHALTTRSSD